VLLPLEIKAAVGLLALVAGVAGYAAWAHKLRAEGAAECQAQHTASALTASEAARAEEQRRQLAAKDIDNETQRLAARDRAAADALHAAGPGLRDAAFSAISRSCPSDSAASAVSPSATEATRVLSLVYGEAAARCAALADLADESWNRGAAAAQHYDALTP